MSTTHENPPAFPCPEMGKEHFDQAGSYPGMTLRDYFAAKATEEDIAEFLPKTSGDCARLAYDLGFAPHEHQPQDSGRYNIRHGVMRKLRYWAKFQHADAMLAERSRKATP